MSFIQTDSKSIWKNNSVPLCLFMVLCITTWSWNMWDRLSMKQLNQIWQHHTTALVVQIQHIFSVSAIINPLLDIALPVSYIFCSIWLVYTPAVLDYLPGSVFLQFCLVSSAGIPRLWQPFQNCLYQSVIFSFGDTLVCCCCCSGFFSYDISHYSPIHCFRYLNIKIILINNLFIYLWSTDILIYFFFSCGNNRTRMYIINKEIIVPVL